MDPTNDPVPPGTSEGVCVPSGEEEEEEEEEDKNELYLPGVGASSGVHIQPDHLGPTRDPVDGRTAADGADSATPAPRELLGYDSSADQPGPHQCTEEDDEDEDDEDENEDDEDENEDEDAGDRRDECPICNERFGPSGGRRLALLHCDHALCRHCLSHILRRARDPMSVQCPFCRQNTPLSSRDFAQIMLEDGCHDGGGAPATSAPLLADLRLGADPDDAATPTQAPLGCLFPPPGSEQQLQQQQQQMGVWGGGGGAGGGGACGGRVCLALRVMMRPACCLPSTTVLLVLMVMVPWLFMSLRYL